MLDLPRAVRLALWGSAVLTGDIDPATALRAVQRDDEPHTVSGEAASASTVAELIAALASGGASRLRVALPAPGDPAGLRGPAAFTIAATDAGEAVVIEGDGPALGLVPVVTEFGSALEPGAMVDWVAFPAAPSPPPSDSLADADRSLREALRAATEVLTTLDVSRWREDAAERIAGVRDGGLPRDAVPPGTDPRAGRVLASAVRVRAIAALALEDDGASVTGWEASRRATVLREVDAVARRCLATAVNAQAPEARTSR